MIHEEGLRVEISKDSTSAFSLINYECIHIPSEIDLNSDKSACALAHELGHYQLFKRFPLFLKKIDILFSGISQTEKYYLIAFPYKLYQEIMAWIIGYKYFKDTYKSLMYYIEIAIVSVFSYIKPLFNSIMYLIKFLIGTYISTVFMVRFFIISKDMQLQWHPIFMSLQKIIISNSDTNSTVTQLFWTIIPICLFYEVFKFGVYLTKLPSISTLRRKEISREPSFSNASHIGKIKGC